MTIYEKLDELAEQDNFTQDKLYNEGLKLVRLYGYNFCSQYEAVKYWVMCNGY